MKTIAEQLEALRATREAHQKKLGDIAQKSMDESRSFNTAEQEEFDDLEGQIKSLDGDIDRLTRLQAVQAKSAVPAAIIARGNEDAVSRGEGRSLEPAQLKTIDKVDAGIGFARVARCLAVSHVHHQSPIDVARAVYPGDERLHSIIQQKAAVPAASTGNAGWAGNLITDGGVAFADFVEWLRPRSLLGQVSDRLRNLPFDTPVLVQGSAAIGKWTKEGGAKPLTRWSYSRAKLVPLKVAAIAAATKETMMRATPAADALLRDELGRAVNQTIDTQFIDPDAAAVADEAPASILNGVPATTVPAGGDADAIRAGAAALMNAIAGANLSLAGSFWAMSERTAIALSLMTNPLGATEFPGINFTGGTFLGLPAFVSAFVPDDEDGAVIALIKGDEIFLGDEGGLQVSMSDQASLVMDDAPTMNSTTPTAQQVVSLWQTNSVAFLVERFINWQRRRAQAVAWARVNWGRASAPTSS
ncbi:Phage capsid family protein [Xanthomonas sp. GW]|uniref:phage major capsid protein n=1 Tax=Xanthomonas sp. GW TaxID=2724121 RepID=UPI00163A5785|nr:phage major capsid protein [Xanthomonas sp. GW]QNH21252.1 Phage capsid family protein [Xanthomonas sp. GW]